MSLSFDPKALETAAQFGAFVQLLQDPKALSIAMAEAKSTLIELHNTLGNLKTKEQVDSYVTVELAKLDGARADFEANKVSMKAEVDAQMKKLTDLTNLVADKKAALDIRTTGLDSRELTIQTYEQDLDSRHRALGQQEQATNIKSQEVQRKEADLDEKLATVKKMLGEK